MSECWENEADACRSGARRMKGLRQEERKKAGNKIDGRTEWKK